jgi:ABC-type amino acid transport/signal transduction systems, periplasmic component/domain
MSNIVVKAALALAVASSFALPALAEDVLRIGMTPEPYLPFGQVNAAGEWEGIEADITNALCERMKVKCEISAMAFDGLLPALKENKLDVASAPSRSPTSVARRLIQRLLLHRGHVAGRPEVGSGHDRHRRRAGWCQDPRSPRHSRARSSACRHRPCSTST